VILVLFCGAGGSTIGVHRALPDAEIIGIDNDRDACATHRTAGFPTIRADLSQLSYAHPRHRATSCSPAQAGRM
jgi:trans-aconitate methyltransferase